MLIISYISYSTLFTLFYLSICCIMFFLSLLLCTMIFELCKHVKIFVVQKLFTLFKNCANVLYCKQRQVLTINYNWVAPEAPFNIRFHDCPSKEIVCLIFNRFGKSQRYSLQLKMKLFCQFKTRTTVNVFSSVKKINSIFKIFRTVRLLSHRLMRFCCNAAVTRGSVIHFEFFSSSIYTIFFTVGTQIRFFLARQINLDCDSLADDFMIVLFPLLKVSDIRPI